ncbi:PREDICTED: E3 ubiquitin-protein ligase ATL31 [Tarenaya hassleriana]|uniref:E3 ubiquitin-protein ligase ATL31 n=1 Tax=Tarenaya hassleriana TaxID=28532 RepID=UPI00053CA2EA|nr:PREDICTED: E3 ubiquitin-protein ligase ATL31 [Tarenaya hassleriana]
MWTSGVKGSIAGGGVSTAVLLFLLLISTAEQAASQPGQSNQRTDPYNYGRISPAMAVIVVVLVAALFFVGFFSIYIRHCTRNGESSLPFAAAAGVRRAANAQARGIDASVIETFPTFVYSEVKTLKIGKGALECAICLNEFEADETLRLLPRCDHVFHPHCIGAWLQGHVTCPVCRTDLAEPAVQPNEPEITGTDVEAQREEVAEPVAELEVPEPDRTRVKLPRSHTTGHSLVQPGENTDRFTLRLPEDVRKRIMANWKMNRSNSVVLPRGGSSRRGKQVDRLRVRSDRWLFHKTPSFLWRNSRGEGSIKLGGTGSTGDSVRSDRWAFLRNPSFLWRNSSVHSPRGAHKDGEGSSVQTVGTGGSTNGSVRLPV